MCTQTMLCSSMDNTRGSERIIMCVLLIYAHSACAIACGFQSGHELILLPDSGVLSPATSSSDMSTFPAALLRASRSACFASSKELATSAAATPVVFGHMSDSTVSKPDSLKPCKQQQALQIMMLCQSRDSTCRR